MSDHITKKEKSSGTGQSGLISGSVCSSTDCTGLIPALPASDAELEAYEEMYRFCSDPAQAEAPAGKETPSHLPPKAR